MRAKVAAAGLSEVIEIDSAGTGGVAPGRAGRRAGGGRGHGRRGVELTSRARQVHAGDFAYFDLLVAMDHANQADLLDLAPSADDRAKVRLLREFDPGAAEHRGRPRRARPLLRRADRVRRRLRPHRRGLRRPARPRPGHPRPGTGPVIDPTWPPSIGAALGAEVRSATPIGGGRHAATRGGSSSTTTPSCSPRPTTGPGRACSTTEADGLRPAGGDPHRAGAGGAGRAARATTPLHRPRLDRARPPRRRPRRRAGPDRSPRSTGPRPRSSASTATPSPAGAASPTPGATRGPSSTAPTGSDRRCAWPSTPGVLSDVTVDRLERVIDRLPELVGPAGASGTDPRRPLGRQRPGRLATAGRG